jgi:hypothetical protein
MKKLLLPLATVLAAAFASFTASADEVLAVYDYSSAYQTGLKDSYTQDNNMGTVTTTLGNNYANQIYVASKNFSTENYKALKGAASIIDLGGEVGRVLCFNGPQSNLAKETQLDVPAFSGIPNVHLYWFCNTTNQNIRVRITYSVCASNSSAASIPDSFYTRPNNTSVALQQGSSYAVSNFLFGDDDDEKTWVNSNNETKWCVYELDTKNTGYAPLAVDFFVNGYKNGFTYNALLISKVEFINVTGSDFSNGTTKTTLVTKTIDPTADHTVVTLGDIENGTFNVSSYRLAVPGSELSNYPAYFANVNTFNATYSIIPDINKTNALGEGESLSFNGTLNGTDVVSVNGVTTGEAIEGNFYYLPFASSYTFKVDEVEASVSNTASAPDANITVVTEADKKYKSSDGVYGAICCNTIQNAVDDNLAGYATFSVVAKGTDDVAYTPEEVGVLSENAMYGIGLDGYAHLESVDDYDDAKHNWASIAIAKGKLPLHFHGVKDGKIETTVSAVYPVLESLQTSEELAEVTVDKLNLKALAKSASATCDLDFSATADQTSVADIAVDADAAVEYFNLQGVRVANPENGIFIRRQGGSASKVLFK